MAPLKKELSRDDWVDAGMSALFDGGIGAVKVDRIAKTLGISRGSFYWHFKDLGDLLTAMIDSWLNIQHQNLKLMTQGSSDPRIRLKGLLDHIQSKDFRHDVSMRFWAHENAAAARAVKQIDTKRLSVVEQAFSDAGFDPDEARFRAHVLYYFQLGDQLSRKHPSAKDRKAQFTNLAELLVTN